MQVSSGTVAAGFPVTGVTQTMLSSNTRANNLALSYVAYRYKKMKLSFTYVGDPKTYGSFWISFYPTGFNLTAADVIYSQSNIVNLANANFSRYQNPGFMIDLSQPCECAIELPWPFPANSAKITNTTDYNMTIDNMSNVGNIMAIAQPSVLWRLFVEYDEFEFLALSPEGKEEKSETKPNNKTRGINYFKGFVDQFSWFVSPIMMIARATVAIGQALGFSRPLMGIESRMIMAKTDFAVASGSSGAGPTLGVDPVAARSVRGIIPGAVEGETRVSALARRKGLLSVSFATGTNLAIDPCSIPTFGASPNQLVMPTPIAFAASFGRYWRGDMIVEMTWYSTPLVRGMARIVLVPPGGNLGGNPISGRFYFVDVCGTTSFKIVVPYEFTTRFRLTTAPNGILVGNTWPNLQWSWIKPPQDNTGATLTINPLVTIHSENFVIDVPELRTPLTTTSTLVLPQGYETGEDIDDLLLLTRRTCFNATVTGSVNAKFAFPVEGYYAGLAVVTGVGTMTASLTSPTFVNYLRLAFYGWTGSQVWTVIPENATATADRLFVWEMDTALGLFNDPGGPRYISGGQNLTTTSGLALLENQVGRSVTIPDRSQERFKSGAVNAAVFTTTPTSAVCFWDFAASGASAYELYNAGGEDFTVGWFLNAPLFKG